MSEACLTAEEGCGSGSKRNSSRRKSCLFVQGRHPGAALEILPGCGSSWSSVHGHVRISHVSSERRHSPGRRVENTLCPVLPEAPSEPHAMTAVRIDASGSGGRASLRCVTNICAATKVCAVVIVVCAATTRTALRRDHNLAFNQSPCPHLLDLGWCRAIIASRSSHGRKVRDRSLTSDPSRHAHCDPPARSAGIRRGLQRPTQQGPSHRQPPSSLIPRRRPPRRLRPCPSQPVHSIR